MRSTQNSLFNTIYQYIEQQELITPGQKIVIGLSGGPDSIFLLHVLAPLHLKGEITLVAAHLNHEWRHNAAQDIEFCRSVTAPFNIPLIDGKLSAFNDVLKNNGSQEDLGRQARRTFLEHVRAQHAADAIALGHHYDDQQETFFIRLVRGATVAGLSAMQPHQGCFIRPLLNTKKAAIVEYLNDYKIPYLIDPTNDTADYLRNRIRHHVIPALHASDNRFDTTFKNTLAHIQETEKYLSTHTAAVFDTITSVDAPAYHIDVKKLCALESFMQTRLLMHWLCTNHVPFTPTTAFFNEIVRFLKNPAGGQHAMHPQWVIKKKHQIASIEKITK